jgi:CHAT domain-containing protein
MSLARGFMAAGVPRVLASLWDVDDQATAEMMRVFYEGYRGPSGLSAAAALRRAQNWMRAQPRWADPYFWAGWTLHGSPT